MDQEPTSFRSYKNDSKTLRHIDDLYGPIENKENCNPQQRKCTHYKRSRDTKERPGRFSRHSLEHQRRSKTSSQLLDTAQTLDGDNVKMSGRVKEAGPIHVAGSFSADARQPKTDILIEMLTKDPSIVSCQPAARKAEDSTDQKGGVTRPAQPSTVFKACEEYFRMIPEIQASQ